MSSTGSNVPEPEEASATGKRAFAPGPEEADRPHVVVTLDTRTGGATFSGPYCTAVSALCAADVEYQVDRDQGGTGELTFHVAVLHSPLGSDDPDPPLDEPPERATGHGGRPLGQARALLMAVAQRAIRRPARLTAGTLLLAAAPRLPDLGDGRALRGRPQLHRLLPGREAR